MRFYWSRYIREHRQLQPDTSQARCRRACRHRFQFNVQFFVQRYSSSKLIKCDSSKTIDNQVQSFISDWYERFARPGRQCLPKMRKNAEVSAATAAALGYSHTEAALVDQLVAGAIRHDPAAVQFLNARESCQGIRISRSTRTFPSLPCSGTPGRLHNDVHALLHCPWPSGRHPLRHMS